MVLKTNTLTSSAPAYATCSTTRVATQGTGKTAINFSSSATQTITKTAGKSTGFLKFLKKVPIIGTALTVATELPSIVNRWSEEGTEAGLKELGKAAARQGISLAAGLVAGAITYGSLGTLGWVGLGVYVGADLLLSNSDTFKSYDDMKDELLEEGVTEEQIKKAREKNIDVNTLYEAMNNNSLQSILNSIENNEQNNSKKQVDLKKISQTDSKNPSSKTTNQQLAMLEKELQTYKLKQNPEDKKRFSIIS